MDLIAAIKKITLTQDERLYSMRSYIESEFPTVTKALKLLDSQNGFRNKGFNLVKRDSKKHGYLYYVRYPHNGKYLPSKWNTGTNNKIEAERYAKENKDRLIKKYVERHDKKIYETFEKYFDSPEFLLEEKRTQAITERVRREYNGVIKNKFVPFLKEKNINVFEKINIHTMSEFQDWMLIKGLKPQSINNMMKAVKRVMAYLFRNNIIKENPGIESLPVRQGDLKPRGCYEMEKIKGVFNKKWDSDRSHLLCMIIYTTGMRNTEIKKIKKEDLILIDETNFINIKESKTENGIRIVPLHENVYKKIIDYSENKKDKETIFNIHDNDVFRDANFELAKKINSFEQMKRENITFYSGRHFFKTMLNAEGLGVDIEEIFMGHKVSGDVAKLYNHRDKQGQIKLLKKAKEMISIIDKCIFEQ